MKKSKKFLMAAMLGNVVESFDFHLYGLLSAILSQLFFPNDQSIISMITFLLMYGVGFLARPLGALFFGHLGDTYGRKSALSLSIILMSIPIAIVGVLPTYQSIGWAAPLILIICRLLQGFSVGGEQMGSVLFGGEHARHERLGFVTSWIIASGFIGAMMASGLCAVITQEGMPDWAWRIPFWLGAFIGLIGIYMRFQMDETPDFKHAKDTKQLKRNPLWSIITKAPRSFVVAVGIGAVIGVMFYLPMTYSAIYLTGVMHKPLSSALFVNTIGLVFLMGLLPLFGHLCDKIGYCRWMMGAAIMIAILSYPIFLLMGSGNDTYIILAQVLMMSLNAGFMAPANVVLMGLFPPQTRYSGMAFGYSVGVAVTGGFTPAFATYLVHVTGNIYTPGYMLLGAAVVAMIVVYQASSLMHHTKGPSRALMYG